MLFGWLKEIIGESYTQETDDKVAKAIGTHFVAKSDFNALNDEKKALTGQLAQRDTQLEELKKVDAAGLQAQISQLQKENEDAKKQHDEAITALKTDAALDAAILAAKGKNTKAIKALIDTSKIKLNKDGGIDNLDLEALKASDGYLFENTKTKREGTGAQGNGAGDAVDTTKMSYSQMVEYLANNPQAEIQ